MLANRDEQVKEILRCGKDPVYFITNYVMIQHPEKGLIPCDLYKFQIETIREFASHRFSIVTKARQLGLSTITAAYCLWYALFHKDKNILVIATKLKTAMSFVKKVKVALQALPPWLLLSKFSTTTQDVKFANRSVITAVPTSEDSGRGESLSLLVVDECAIISNFDNLWTNLSPTISTGGSAILLSTPYGVGGQFYKMWVEAQSGMNNFHPIRLPWDVHPEHDQKWFENECKRLASSKKVAQELLCDFLASGDTFLQQEDFDYVKSTVCDPIERSGNDHGIWTWVAPECDHKYVIGADVARGDSADYSTFQVLDTGTYEVVAEYKGKTPPDKLAELMMETGRKYNNALLCPENNTFGYTTAVRLRDLDYPNLYYTSMRSDVFGTSIRNPDEVPGFSTQKQSRIQILSKLEEVIRNRVLKIHSSRLYEEVKTFVWKGTRAQASADANDDLVMAIAIAVWITDTSLGRDTSSQELTNQIVKSMGTFKSSNSADSLQTVNQVVPPGVIGNNMSGTPPSLTPAGSGRYMVSNYIDDYKWLMR